MRANSSLGILEMSTNGIEIICSLTESQSNRQTDNKIETVRQIVSQTSRQPTGGHTVRLSDMVRMSDSQPEVRQFDRQSYSYTSSQSDS